MTPRDPATVDLLFACVPLLKLAPRSLRPAFRRAWLEAATGTAAEFVHTNEENLPAADPAPAALKLFDQALRLCEACGVHRADLTVRFNDQGEAGDYGQPKDFDEALRSLFGGALALAIANEKKAELEASPETRSAAQ